MNIASLLKWLNVETQQVRRPNPMRPSKHLAGCNNHNQSESKKRRKMAAQSRRINRRRENIRRRK